MSIGSVDTPTRLLLGRVAAAWRQRWPSIASLRGDLRLGDAEDLSDAALDQWGEMVAGFADAIDQLDTPDETTFDGVIALSLRRFVTDEQSRAQALDLKHRLSGYPSLIAATIFPFTLLRPETLLQNEVHLLQRLDAVGRWLGHVRDRANAGVLSATPTDVDGMRFVQSALFEQRGSFGVLRPTTLLRIDELLNEMDHCTTRMPVGSPTPRRRNAGTAVRGGAGVGGRLRDHSSEVEAAIERTVGALARLPITPDAGEPSRALRVLPFMRDCYDVLIARWGSTTRVASIGKAPRIARILGRNALYCRGSHALDVAPVLLFNEQSLLPPRWPEDAPLRALSVEQCAYLASVVGHELVPGHHEHFEATYEELAANMDVLQAATGLEGWALHVEGMLPGLLQGCALVPNPAMTRLALVQRILSLAATLIWLMRAQGRGEIATERVALIASQLPASEAARIVELTEPSRAAQPHYGLGVLDVEKVLRELTIKLGNERLAIDRYMRAGPIAPNLAGALSRP